MRIDSTRSNVMFQSNSEHENS